MYSIMIVVGPDGRWNMRAMTSDPVLVPDASAVRGVLTSVLEAITVPDPAPEPPSPEA